MASERGEKPFLLFSSGYSHLDVPRPPSTISASAVKIWSRSVFEERIPMRDGAVCGKFVALDLCFSSRGTVVAVVWSPFNLEAKKSVSRLQIRGRLVCIYGHSHFSGSHMHNTRIN